MSSVQKGFLIRTYVLIAAVAAGTFVSGMISFESRQDLFMLAVIVLTAAAVATVVSNRFILRPMNGMISMADEARQKEFATHFSGIIDNMQEGIVVLDENGVREWNRAALKILDVNERQLRQLEPHTAGWRLTTENGADLAFDERPSQQCLRSGIPIAGVIGVNKPNGEMAWVRVHASPIFANRTAEDRRSGALPKVASVVTTYRDITSEREALQRFELAMKAVKLGVWDWDLVNGRITWDEALCEIYGLEPSTFKRGYDAFEAQIVHEDRERVRRTIELAIHECRDCSIEFHIRRSDGAIRVIRAESKGFYSRDGKAIRHVGVNWDITEQREQEIKMLQASKMSSLGEMSAGIAHEINNPLAIIIGKSEAMRSVLQSPNFNKEAMTRHLDVIERTANRIAKIVKSLRAFSRDAHGDPFEATNVGEIVNEALALCHSRFVNHGIELSVSNVAQDLMIDARAVQISQVLLNLLNNSFDAVMPLEDKWVRVEVTSDSRFIEFSVTDSGKGIPADVREKMAQPFFTTKEVGMGTGMGLSIATGIVQAHSGTISVDMACPNTRIAVRIPKTQRAHPTGPTAA